ncbi:MAG: T9SS type A sorting domain-containing protein, partial [Lewinellaceae bacterium]|nr:T9SS type A sorting domain-containing protein [Lewinellaceae bacterium]
PVNIIIYDPVNVFQGCAVAYVNVDPPTETCSDECEVSVSLVGQPVCDDNDTPSDPADDQYTFTLNVTNLNNAGNTWTARLVNGTVLGSGTYGSNVNFGPYNIGNGNPVTIFVTADSDPDCVDQITVTPPTNCSTECAISVVQTTAPACNDNGTEANPTDDYWSFAIEVAGNNTSGGWSATDNFGNIYGGAYNQSTPIGNFGAQVTSVTLNITDAENPDCTTSITIAAPEMPCSEECAINITVVDVYCDDQGTPYNGADDQYYAIIYVTGYNTGSKWVVSGSNTQYSYGPNGTAILAMGNSNTDVPVAISVHDVSDPSCSASTFVTSPGPCDQCGIEIVLGDTVCDDNGTANPADDTYTVEVTVVCLNNCSVFGWTQIGGQGLQGQFGQTVTFGPFSVFDEPTIEIADKTTFLSCRDQVTLQSPGPCSEQEECDITIDLMNIRCSDNGTPADLSDDYNEFMVWISGNGISDCWTADNGTTGAYGQYTFYFPADGQQHPLVITDCYNQECQATITLQSTDPCPTEECQIYAEVTNVLCNDNGTSNDPTDDFNVFTVSLSGNAEASNCWTADNGESGLYGQHTFTYPADGQMHTVVITDCDSEDCQTILELQSTMPCSEGGDCQIAAVLLEKHCELNTMEDPEDDSTVFTILVTSTSQTICWTDGLGGSGTFSSGILQIFEYESNGDFINFEFTACDDETCSTTLSAQTFIEPCNVCQTGVDLLEVWCDNQGTASDQTDDVFYFTLIIVDSLGNQGPTWHTEGLSTETSGVYSFENVVTFGPFLISNGPANFDIISDLTDDCPMVVFITPPVTCSCGLTAEIGEVDCLDDGSFTVSLTIDDGPSNGWFAEVGGQSVGFGFYGTTQTFGPFTGETTIEIYDFGNENCSEFVVIDPADYCTECNIWPTITNVTCQDNGTPFNPDDDYYTFDLMITGGTGSGWNSVIGSGDYGVTYTFTSGNSANMNFNVYDNEDPNCAMSVFVQSPAPCEPEPCVIESIVVTDVVCNDNGTPGQGADDYYTATILVTAENPGMDNTWVATWNGGTASGTYGDPVQIGPFLGETAVTITDSNLDDCSDVVTVTPPELEVEFPDDINVVVNLDGDEYLLYCSDVNLIMNSEASLEITGIPEMLDECGFITFDFSDEYFDGGDCEESMIIRTFTVYGIGNVTLQGVQQIIISLPDVNEVIGLEDVNIDCTEAFETDENGHPAPSLTGYPTYATYFGVEDVDLEFCGLSATYVDEITSDCSSSYVITRTWTIEDPCTGTQVVFTQLITVSAANGGGLVVECPLSTHFCPILEENIMLFTTDPFECTGTVEVPMPIVSGGVCSSPDFTWTAITQIWTMDGTEMIALILPGDDRTLFDVPVGDYIVRYIVTDDCGVSTTQDCYFRVADLDNPVAVCDDGMNISLGGFGLARVYTFQIDNGSYDNCGIDSILVRRIYTRDPMTCDTLLEPLYSAWGPYVEFSCCDAGLYVTVEMRVVDVNGNENFCWSEILVEDNTLPLCYGLENVTVGCDELPYEFDAYNLGHLSQLFGMPDVVDNCSAEAIEFAPIVNLSDCGYGTIIRRFQAIDVVGNLSMDIFQQVVTITGTANYEIKLPQDTETDCIDNAYTVELFHTGCDSIVVTYEDEFLPIEGEECYNVLRTYHIINYCEWDGISAPVNISRDEDCDGIEGEEDVWIIRTQDTTFVDYDNEQYNMVPAAGTKGTACDGETNPEGYWRITESTGYWTYTQHVVIHDTIAPVVVFEMPDAFCTHTAACETEIVYPFTVTENCIADNLSIRIFLDAGADGTIDLDLTDSGILEGSYPDYVLTGVYPIGTHNFELAIDDGCGNTTTAILPFEVVDCYIPQIVCYSGLMVNLQAVEPGVDVDGDGLADDGFAEVLATQLANCLVSDCSAPLRFSVNRIGEVPNPDSTSIILTCKDRYSITLEVYMWDSAFNPYSVQPDGSIGGPNYDQCEVLVFVQDPLGVCPTCTSEADLHGRIATILNKPIEGVDVTLTNTNTTDLLDEDVTEEDGLYDFWDVTLGEDYTITPEKDYDYLNGVTTMDLIVIQQHLLGTNPIVSPYLLLAADVNNSGAVTVLDLIEIKKLILGQISEFSQVPSWIFIDKSYVFPEPANPWYESRPQTITLGDLSGCEYHLDFIGIKMGDVNMTASPSDFGGLDFRNEEGQFKFGVLDQELEQGQEYNITFTAPDLAKIRGYQFTLNFDQQFLDFVEVVDGIANQDNFGLDFLDRGLITTSWHNPNGNTIFVSKEDVPQMFKLKFRAREHVSSLSEVLSIGSAFTPEEAYGKNGEQLGVDIQYYLQSEPVAAVGYNFELYQNVPNPFTHSTVIGFELPHDAATTLIIRDVSGREVKKISGNFEKGYNEITLEKGTLTSGVYYYTLTTGEFTASRKMIVQQ